MEYMIDAVKTAEIPPIHGELDGKQRAAAFTTYFVSTHVFLCLDVDRAHLQSIRSNISLFGCNIPGKGGFYDLRDIGVSHFAVPEPNVEVELHGLGGHVSASNLGLRTDDFTFSFEKKVRPASWAPHIIYLPARAAGQLQSLKFGAATLLKCVAHARRLSRKSRTRGRPTYPSKTLAFVSTLT